MSIFSKHAMNYFESGYAVIPLDGKKPQINEWSKYSVALPTDDEIEALSRLDGNIGLVCGKASGVIAFDYDYSQSDAKRIESILNELLPPSPVRKVGKKGFTSFYRYNGIASISKNRRTSRMFDLLSDGKQTVLPPSIHPDTGEQYQWITEDTLLDVNQKDLPELPQTVVDMLCELAEVDFEKGDHPFGKRTGRHDVVVAYALAIIEQCLSLDEFAAKMVDYDLKKHSDDPYFSDKKYFNGKNPVDAAKEIAKRVEKTVIGLKKKRGIEWRLDMPTEKRELWIDDITLVAAKHRFLNNGFCYDSESGSLVKQYKEFAEFFCDVFGFRVYNGCYNWIYNGNYFEEVDLMYASHLTSKYVDDRATVHAINQFIKTAQIKGARKGYFPGPSQGFVNLKNGVYDLKNKKLLPRSKKFNFNYMLKYEFDENAKCDAFDTFLDEVLPSADVKKSVYEIFGYMLSGDKCWLQKSFFLDGEGQNGKSIFLKVIDEMLGEENTASVSLSQLTKPFMPMLLFGKLANVCEESSGSMIDAEIFRNLSTGGNITSSKKGKDMVKFENKAKMIFSVNGMPSFSDTSWATLRRLYIIPFNTIIMNQDRGLEKKLKAEIPGVFLKSVIAYDDLVKRGHLIETEDTAMALNEYKEIKNDVYNFISECYIVSSVITSRSMVKDEYGHYELWCRLNGYKFIKTKIEFSRRFKSELTQILIQRKLNPNGAFKKLESGMSFALAKRDLEWEKKYSQNNKNSVLNF